MYSVKVKDKKQALKMIKQIRSLVDFHKMNDFQKFYYLELLYHFGKSLCPEEFDQQELYELGGVYHKL